MTLPLVKVTVEKSDGSQLSSIAMGPTIPLGRGVSQLGFMAAIYIEDLNISREHAELIVDEHGGLLVKDLGSRNGTLVGNRRLAPGEIQPLGPDGKFTLGGLPATARLVDKS